jgi:Ser/Thr protein kinase RdoA (MazF antagonist)
MVGARIAGTCTAGPMSAVVGAVRPIAPPDLLEHLRKTYSIGGVELTMDLGGSRNLNLMVTSGAGMLVVRVYRNGMTLDRLAAIQSVRRALNAKGVPASTVVRTRSGESWSQHGGRLIEVEEFVEHNARLDSWGRLDVGLPILGRAHGILRTLSVSPAGRKPPIANYLGTAEIQVWTPRAMERTVHWSLPAEYLRRLHETEALAVRLYRAEDANRGRLPVQLIHGNFWGTSVLFRNRKVVLVTDLDFMAEQPRIEDLALTLYYANSTLAEDPSSDACLRHLRTLVDAYDAQLDVHLTPDERKALPLTIARAPLAAVRDIAQSGSADEAKQLISRMSPDVAWATAIAEDLPRWQEGFS